MKDKNNEMNNENNDLIKKTILYEQKNKAYINLIKISPYGNVIYFINEEKCIIFYR